MTNFVFENYTQIRRGRPSEPWLSTNNLGHMTLSAAASELLDNPMFVILMFDHQQGCIGIKAATALDGLKVSRTVKGTNHGRVSAMGFCSRFGIRHSLPKLPVELHGDTLIARLPAAEPPS